jgi:integrase
MRWSELVRARVQDVQGGRLVIRRSKSGKVRRIPLPPELLAECQGRVGRLVAFEDVCEFNKRVRELSGIDRFHSHLAFTRLLPSGVRPAVLSPRCKR